MRRVITISVLALVLLSTRVLPQQAPVSGVIEGTVVRADNGEPIAGAHVMLTGNCVSTAGTTLPGSEGPRWVSNDAQAPPRPSPCPTVVTGGDGKFSFKNLKTGTYGISATASGFVITAYGQRTPFGQARRQLLAAGQTVKDADIRMFAAGVISGRVFDEKGQSAPGVPLGLLRVVYVAGGQTHLAAGTDLADDRGYYRIHTVTPGRYYLLAGTGPRPSPQEAFGGTVGSERFSHVLYPAAESFDQASMIEVKAGAETSIDMRVRRQPQTFRVRGRIVDSTGSGLPVNSIVTLAYRTIISSGTFGSGRRLDSATGVFEFQDVPPGDYDVEVQVPAPSPGASAVSYNAAISATQARQAQLPSGRTSIRVIDADVDGVVVNLRSPITATGRFSVEGQPLSVFPNIQQLGLSFTSSTSASVSSPLMTTVTADGTFQVAGLREDQEYRVNLRGAPAPGFYIKSMRYGGEDIQSRSFKVSGSDSGTFEVVLRSGAAQVSGIVTDAQSQPARGVSVVLIPAQRNRGDLYRTSQTDQNGRFSLTRLTPGEYKLFSWEAIDSGAPYDPEFLKQYEPQGRSIMIADGSNNNVDVKLIPAR
jgi:hypothetical protein